MLKALDNRLFWALTHIKTILLAGLGLVLSVALIVLLAPWHSNTGKPALVLQHAVMMAVEQGRLFAVGNTLPPLSHSNLLWQMLTRAVLFLHLPVTVCLSVFSALCGVVVMVYVSLTARQMSGKSSTWIAVLLAAGSATLWTGMFQADSVIGEAALILGSLCGFYQWFDTGFHSRTACRSMLRGFALTGIILGLSFWCHGLPGLLLPLSTMALTVTLSLRWERFYDLNYHWLLWPIGSLALTLLVLSGFTWGWAETGLWLLQWPWRFSWPHGILFNEWYWLPLAGALFLGWPGLWQRLVLSHKPALYFLASSLLISHLGRAVFPSLSQPLLYVDMMAGVCLMTLALDNAYKTTLIPAALRWGLPLWLVWLFIAGSVSMTLAFQWQVNGLQAGLLGLGLALCGLSLFGMFRFDWLQTPFCKHFALLGGLLITLLSHRVYSDLIAIRPEAALMAQPNVQSWLSANPSRNCLSWQLPSPGWVDLSHEIYCDRLTRWPDVEAQLSNRNRPTLAFLSDTAYYRLPESLQSQAIRLGEGWQWRYPVTWRTVLKGILHESWDFNALTTPVLLIALPEAAP